MNIDGVLDDDAGNDVVLFKADRARYGSPLLSSVVSSLMRVESGATWQSLQVDGWFSGIMDLDTSQVPSWHLSMSPEDVAMTYGGERLLAEFDSADVSMNSESGKGVLVGRSNFGAFDIKADARLDQVVDLDIDFDFEGQLGASQTLAILPSQLSDALREIDWQDGRGTAITNGRLSLELHGDEDLDSIEFTGQLETNGSSMEIGVEIKEIDATLDGSYVRLKGGIPVLDMDVSASRLLAAGRLIEDLQGTMVISQDGSDLLIPSLTGNIADGGVSLEMGMALASD
jgi:hypothetical protein